ncbi:MAG: phytanoyl-CoA dioxygenase family protein [Gammaproteobacteria bacterium]|nr:phytanoyl-CoA dioxygenase family protein [Gammaproteobacteria bacterium]
MQIEDWESAESLPALYRELQSLGLETNIAELEAFGFTVVPPEKVAPPEFHAEVKVALERVMKTRFGANASAEHWAKHWRNTNDILRFILWDDPIFERVVMLPAALGLIQYLVGTNCILSLCDGWVKGTGDARTAVHCDWTDFTRKTFSAEPNHANVNYMLTDYSIDEGCIGFVPGSHRWRRFPSNEEAGIWGDRLHPIEAPAGSIVVWGDHTWHGSLPRSAPGERLMILCEYARPRLQTQEPFRETVTQAALDRNPIRFTGLMDVYGPFPFGKSDRQFDRADQGPPGSGAGMSARLYCSLFDREPAAGRTSLRPAYKYMEHDGLMVRERSRAVAVAGRTKRRIAEQLGRDWVDRIDL